MGVTRRAIIGAAVGGTVGVLFTPIPWKLADDISIWTQNWPWIPTLDHGAVEHKPAIGKFCPSGCAVKVRTVAGNPVSTTGNPDNPLSGGGICPLCAVGVQMKYSPSRVKQPMKKTGEGSYQPIGWDEALKTLSSKLGGLKGKDGKLVCISGDQSGTCNEVFSALVAGLGNSDFYLMPSAQNTAALAWNQVMGGTGQVGYDIENADFVLSIGADLLDSWGPTVRNQKVFGEKGFGLVYAGPVCNRTAAVGEKWVPVASDGLTAFALGVAYFMMQRGATVNAADFDDFKSMVMSNYSPDKVEAATGVKATELEKVAARLMSASRPVVVSDTGFGQGQGAAGFIAATALNLLAGNLNSRGGMVALSDLPVVVEGAMERADVRAKDLVGYLAKMEKGKVTAPEVLVTYEANAVYGLPQAEAFAKAVEKIPFKVALTSYMDETASKADLILPVPNPLERIEDIQTPYGYGQVAYAVAAPVSKPAVDAKSGADVFFALADGLGVNLGYSSFEDVLKAKAEKIGADYDSLVEEGQLWTSDSYQYPTGLSLAPSVLAKAGAAPKDGAYPLSLAPEFQLNVGTQSLATPPQNLNTIPKDELDGNLMGVAMNSATAKKAGVKAGSRITITGPRGECRGTVTISEGVADGVVAAPLGLGRTAWDPYTRGKGDNTFKVLSVTTEPGTGMAVWGGSRVKIA